MNWISVDDNVLANEWALTYVPDWERYGLDCAFVVAFWSRGDSIIMSRWCYVSGDRIKKLEGVTHWAYLNTPGESLNVNVMD